MNKSLEILAPAGSTQALEAALCCGADAVYLGIETLNARRNAENFTSENLAQTVRRCHIHGTKVYLTLNTVVLENEIGELLRAASCACEAGVDAAIVQDLGVAAVLRRCCPDLKLNASTQMTIHNVEGAKMLEKLGFCRVVLARECSKEEIRKIVQETSLEVEVFIHGALCMCVSGQCYMSSVLGQRSGNRGLCAQPCRLDFESISTDHALSLKDMSLIARIDELKEIGVTSVKIEGRMKRPEYVAAAVTACRNAREGEPVDLESLRAVFSRSGFTEGYFTGNRTIDMFGIRQKEDVKATSGVLGKLETLYTDPRKRVQKVPVSFLFEMHADQPAMLTVTDCDGNRAAVHGDIPQVALHKPTDEQRVKAGLSKTGGTPYRVQNIDCDLSEGLMLPVSSLNAMRREALDQLSELRGKPHRISFDPAKMGTPAAGRRALLPKIRIRAYKAAQITPIMYEQAELITLPIPELIKLCEKGTPDHAEKLCAGLPRMLFSGQKQLHKQLDILWNNGIRHVSAGNLGTLEIASHTQFQVHGEPYFNVTNAYAIQVLSKLGVSDLHVSFELNLDTVKRMISKIPLGVAAYGKLPLMLVRTCPVRVSAGCANCKAGENFITDRKGNRFYTNCSYGCCEILNPIPLYMGDRLGELKQLDFITLNFTIEQPQECERIFRLYQEGGEFGREFTRGLLYKTIF